jgi:ribosomal protein S18 acetylase RimI-like enzyme
MTLAPATDGDLPEVVALMNRAYRGDAGWATESGYLTGPRIRLEDLRADVAAKPGFLLVWRRDGRLAGCAGLEPEGDGAWFLSMLTVDPDIQQQRLGRRLLDACEARVREAGGTHIRMTVIWLRDMLIAWYARRGYLPTGGTRPFPYGETRWGEPTRNDLYFVVLEKPLT